jgi:putative ABC transport system permease protein
LPCVSQHGNCAAASKAFASFLACLALGVAAIAAVGSVREAIQEGLSREGAAILGGDAEMSFHLPLRL